MNYSIRVGETVLCLSVRVQSTAFLGGSAYCSVSPPALVHLVKSKGEPHLPRSPPRVLQQSEGRGTAGETGTTPVTTVPVPEVCGSPHTADVVRDHVAALVAVECFGKFWEILKGAQYPEFPWTVYVYFNGINSLFWSVCSTPHLSKV